MGIDPNSLDAEIARRQQEAEIAAEAPKLSDEEAQAEIQEQNKGVSSGQSVMTSDGREIGRVRDVSRGYFSIDCGPEDDYWLSTLYVAETRGDKVSLTFPSAEAEAHRLRQPGIETVDRTLTGTGTLDQTRVDALRIREQMEHELLEQRGTIDTGVQTQ